MSTKILQKFRQIFVKKCDKNFDKISTKFGQNLDKSLDKNSVQRIEQQFR